MREYKTIWLVEGGGEPSRIVIIPVTSSDHNEDDIHREAFRQVWMKENMLLEENVQEEIFDEVWERYVAEDEDACDYFLYGIYDTIKQTQFN